jgi:acyl transferase domain-containing protein
MHLGTCVYGRDDRGKPVDDGVHVRGMKTTISYIEAHGTGTALGDPVEIAGLTQAFRIGTDKTGFCTIGSVKTNIGHLDAAAGVTGLIKTTLALHHKVLPATLHYQSPNPRLELSQTPLVVNAASGALPADMALRYVIFGGEALELNLGVGSRS